MRKILQPPELVEDPWQYAGEEDAADGRQRRLIVPLAQLLAEPSKWTVAGTPDGARTAAGTDTASPRSAGPDAAPGTGAAAPDTGAAAPDTGAAAPGTGAAAPGTGAAAPGTGAAAPDTGAAAPDTGAAAPDTGAAAPDTGAVTGTSGGGIRALGVRVGPAERIEDLAPHLPQISLVAIEFPGPGDGRGYTFARLLRQRYGFRGEVRAVGPAVKQDLLFPMARSGFDTFELAAGQDPAQALKALSRYTLAYQTAVPHAPVRVARFTAAGG